MESVVQARQVPQIKLAHLRDQGIDFAVFDADAVARTQSARASLLAQLTTVSSPERLSRRL